MTCWRRCTTRRASGWPRSRSACRSACWSSTSSAGASPSRRAPSPSRFASRSYFVNPEIVWESDEVGAYNEGCLSVPELFGDVVRPLRIRAKWLDYNGNPHEEELDGLMATCLQHEMDHLEGILFFDHLSKLKRDMIVKKLTKAKRGKIAA